MRGIVLITLFTLILNFRMPQYDTGNIVIVTSYTGHILEAQSAVPRQIVHDIQFSIVFEIAPQIFIQSSLLDWSIGTPNGYIERASFITTKGFKIHGIAVTPSPVYSLYVYWLAVNDDRIQVITFDTWDVKELKTGTGQREVPFELVHTLKDATQGIISVTGIKHLAYNPIVELSIDIITSESVKVSAKSYSLSQLEYLRFNILLGTDQSLWTTSKLSLINGPTHPFVSRSPSAYHLYMKFDLPNLYYNYEQIPLVAFRGYDCDNRVNLRLLYKDVAINTQLQFTLATCKKLNYTLGSDSVVYSVFYQAGIYLFDSNHKIFDENCAELFSECNFQGFSLKVCNKISNLLNKGWSQLVKSVTVPKQKKLLLFQYTNFEGEQSAIIQNQKCMEANVQSVNFNPTVSFIKILFLNSNGGVGVAFYSECYYQGASFSIIKGQQAKLSSKIPFEIKSIDIPANVIVKLKDAYFFGAEVKEFSSSQNCINTYKVQISLIQQVSQIYISKLKLKIKFNSKYQYNNIMKIQVDSSYKYKIKKISVDKSSNTQIQVLKNQLLRHVFLHFYAPLNLQVMSILNSGFKSNSFKYQNQIFFIEQLFQQQRREFVFHFYELFTN